MGTSGCFVIGILGAKVQSSCVRRCVGADDVLIVPYHMPHGLGLIEKAYARMRSEDPAQKGSATPAHPNDKRRAIDLLTYATRSEAQVGKHDWIPPASSCSDRSTLKE
jgi:hypothetical protein